MSTASARNVDLKPRQAFSALHRQQATANADTAQNGRPMVSEPVMASTTASSAEKTQLRNTSDSSPGVRRTRLKKPFVMTSRPMSMTVSCIIRHTSAATDGLLLSTPNTGRPSEM